MEARLAPIVWKAPKRSEGLGRIAGIRITKKARAIRFGLFNYLCFVF